MRKKGITIAEVARLAGVSASTVSRVTKGFARIAPETRKRVETIIRENHFVPEKRTSSAPSRSRLKYGKVVFLVPDSERSAAMSRIALELAQGADEVLARQNVELLVRGLEQDGSLPALIRSNRVDGVICKNWPGDPSLVEQLGKIPLVWCLSIPLSRAVGDQANCDNTMLAQMAVRHFGQKGVTDICLFSHSTQLSEMERRNELKKYAVDAGFHFHVISQYVNFSFPVNPSVKYGIVIENADIILPLIHMQLIGMGLHQGVNAEIICMNSMSVQVEQLDPSLLRMEFNTYEIGVAAANLLLWRLENPNALHRRVLIEPSLIVPAV